MRRYRFLLMGLAAAVLAGCMPVPKYTRPEPPVPAGWPNGPAYDNADIVSGTPAAAGFRWRDYFADQRLQTVIETALANNRDLRAAALNVERARALYGIQRAELYPAVDASAGASQARVPADLSSNGGATTREAYGVNLGIASWEIDFFGRIRSLKAAALEEYLATEQAGRSARILLISSVATAYLTLAADREGLHLAEATLESQQAAYDLIRRRYDVGLSPELDVHQAQTRVEAARVDVALYTRLAAQDENALDLLAGAPVPAALLPTGLSAVGPFPAVSPGLPSETLLRRPDILQAEGLLKAANANIGAARATLFPRISLTAAAGTASSELSGLFRPGSGAWSYSSQVVLPIFDARAWAALEVTKVDREIAVARYEQAIQTAFREVADVLALEGTVQKQLSAQQSLTDAVAATYRLSNARYSKGIDNYLGVLDAQRSLYGAQQGLIAVRLAKLANQVRLYAVLGGGGGDTAPER
jgi:outer membrane protein, multidrug efflux system